MFLFAKFINIFIYYERHIINLIYYVPFMYLIKNTLKFYSIKEKIEFIFINTMVMTVINIYPTKTLYS